METSMIMIIHTFDADIDAIINPSHMVSHIENFPKIAVVTFNRRLLEQLQEKYGAVQIDYMIACVEIPVYRIHYEGKDIAVYCTTLGGPAASGLLEEMIAKGCEKFVFFGSCGVLDRRVTATSLIVPTAAYRDEGTSYHYAPPSEYIEIVTAGRLADILTELNLPYVCGKTWTTDAIYRETRANMEKRKLDGCLTVEMECSSIMAVANFREVPVYQYLYAADSLAGEEWEIRTFGNLTQDVHGKFLRIALEIAIRV
jgi:uridine phosphorylase